MSEDEVNATGPWYSARHMTTPLRRLMLVIGAALVLPLLVFLFGTEEMKAKAALGMFAVTFILVLFGGWGLLGRLLNRVSITNYRVPFDEEEELKMAQSFQEWLEFDAIEREKRKAAMTDEELRELKSREIAYYNRKKDL